MPVDCQRSTSGGKGNLGMFIERDRGVCAAGLPSAQPDERVGDSLRHYLLKDAADALAGDAVVPPRRPRPPPPLRRPVPPDKRFAGTFGDVAQLINPPIKTKFQTLVDDFKETPYSSYWKRPLGGASDPAPMLPGGFDAFGTTFGRATEFHGRLYDVVMPKDGVDDTPPSKQPGYRAARDYCAPPYDADLTFGCRSLMDKRGKWAKCCLTDDRIPLGTSQATVVNAVQSRFQDANQPRIGEALAPNDNISNLPEGHAFGKLKPPDNLPECLTYCDIDPGRNLLKKCLSHLNSLRKCLSTRFLPNFFRTFYLSLKYNDSDKSGWLPKEVVYETCASKLIRFDSALIEPLLSAWGAFDGSRIEYETFVRVINYREPSPEIPYVPDLPAECLDFRTTYADMVRPEAEARGRMAGLPSGRYFDLDQPATPERCCRADRTCLPHEADARACLCPSVLTLLHVSHRDMFARREPRVVRRVFEAAGEAFSDEKFDTVWQEAKKYHSEGWVCYETFRRALEKASQE